MRKACRVSLRAPRTRVVRTALALFDRELQRRTGITMEDADAEHADLLLAVRPGIGAEGFEVSAQGKGTVVIAGGDDRGLLYGVGKFLRTSTFERGTFRPSAWRGRSVPERSVRGMYFATHFQNYYHAAPVREIERYVEELALWGCNALAVWFDMHHFAGIQDPAAQAMLRRLRSILRAAKRAGMQLALTTLVNEAYAGSPPELRADWTAGHDGYFQEPAGHYRLELCPSKPGALDLILRWRREMLEAFADLGIGHVIVWPYDQGGCTCGRCAPWGCNGFLRTAEPVARLVREVLPEAKVVLSTWYFDHFTSGEWAGLQRAFAQGRPAWADYLMADDNGDNYPAFPLEHGVPGGLPLLNFPEISMYRMRPWGGYGANPLPAHFQTMWDTVGARLSGGFPYSEGIFEDMNKAVVLQHYWGGRPAAETVREYAAYEFGAGAADEVRDVVGDMEAQHGHDLCGWKTPLTIGELRRGLCPAKRSETPQAIYRATALRGAADRARRLARIERRMPAADRDAWRWRILRLRAEVDAEIERSEGRTNERLDALFSELDRIYHTRKGILWLRPPGRRQIIASGGSWLVGALM